MTSYTAPSIVTAAGIALLAFAPAAPSDGAFVAAWVLGIVVAGLGALTGIEVALRRRRVADSLILAARLGRLDDRTLDRLADR